MESARLPNGMMDGAGGGGGGMPKGKPKGALPATPGCPPPGTAPGIIEGGVCWLGNGEGPWGPGGGTPGGTAPGWGAPPGCCCCGPAGGPVCPICSEGPRLPGGTPLLAGAGATEAGAMARPWTVGGPAAPAGGMGWEPGGMAGGGCCCCWCICWKCCCRALISAYFSCSMWKACLSARSCCL